MKKRTHQIKERIRNNKPVYSAAFIFRIKNYDPEFERLNSLIDEIANSSPGYLGKQQWFNDEEQKRSVVYYWKSLKALKKFSNHPHHQAAKRNYKKWYSGYEIIIAKVMNLKYDDGIR